MDALNVGLSDQSAMYLLRVVLAGFAIALVLQRRVGHHGRERKQFQEVVVRDKYDVIKLAPQLKASPVVRTNTKKWIFLPESCRDATGSTIILCPR